jgi:hypothetical protein
MLVNIKVGAMKYIIAFVFSLGAFSAVIAQDNPYDTMVSAPGADSLRIEQPVVIDVFVVDEENKPAQTEFGKACTLKRQEANEQIDLDSANAFKMKDKDMHVERKVNGEERVKFNNELEALDYHKEKNGAIHYKYNYYKDKNENLSFKKRKNGKGTGKFKTLSESDEGTLVKRGTMGVERDITSCMR